MKLKELLSGVPVLDLCADGELDITDISYDSRKTVPGGLFVAISGYTMDGHAYIGKAVENGAACVVCERPPEIDIPYVRQNRLMVTGETMAWYADRFTDRSLFDPNMVLDMTARGGSVPKAG